MRRMRNRTVSSGDGEAATSGIKTIIQTIMIKYKTRRGPSRRLPKATAAPKAPMI